MTYISLNKFLSSLNIGADKNITIIEDTGGVDTRTADKEAVSNFIFIL